MDESCQKWRYFFQDGEQKLVEMSNGCICCGYRRDDLIREVANLPSGRFDYLLIESNRCFKPAPEAADIFSTGDQLTDLSSITITLVTAVMP